jgi:hypothetical protein
MSNGELPDGLIGWALAGIGAAMGTLVTTIATLWKVSESKNAKAIEEQHKEIAVVRTEMQGVRDNLKITEQARLECERDRASLMAKCEIFEARLSRLEGKA